MQAHIERGQEYILKGPVVCPLPWVWLISIACTWSRAVKPLAYEACRISCSIIHV